MNHLGEGRKEAKILIDEIEGKVREILLTAGKLDKNKTVLYIQDSQLMLLQESFCLVQYEQQEDRTTKNEILGFEFFTIFDSDHPKFQFVEVL